MLQFLIYCNNNMVTHGIVVLKSLSLNYSFMIVRTQNIKKARQWCIIYNLKIVVLAISLYAYMTNKWLADVQIDNCEQRNLDMCL